VNEMFEYNICNQADAEIFRKQCHALEKNIPNMSVGEFLEDVDGSLIQLYTHPNGNISVRNDTQVDALYVTSEFDLLPYFKH